MNQQSQPVLRVHSMKRRENRHQAQLIDDKHDNCLAFVSCLYGVHCISPLTFQNLVCVIEIVATTRKNITASAWAIHS